MYNHVRGNLVRQLRKYYLYPFKCTKRTVYVLPPRRSFCLSPIRMSLYTFTADQRGNKTTQVDETSFTKLDNTHRENKTIQK